MGSITRRQFNRRIAGGLGGAALASSLPWMSSQTRGSAPSQSNRPNILWLSCEDISPHLGCYGDPNAVTPTLDNLAAGGVRYANAFTTSGVCAPNRSSIITGMYSTTLGTHHMRSGGEGTERSIKPVPPPHIRTFTEYLRAAGYYCSNNAKEDYNFDAPEAAWDESSDEAHWRNRPDEDTPFFAVFNYTGSHEGSIRLDEAGHAERTSRLTPDQRQDPADLDIPPYYPDTPLVRQTWAEYYELITALDYWVSDMLGQLEADGLVEDTIVFFWSDHGVGLPRAKRWLYDSGTHMPLIIRIPERYRSNGQPEPGTVSDALVSSIDFGPTVLNLAGIDPPEYMQGRPYLGSDLPPSREYVYGARDRMDERYDIIRMVRNKRFKYLRNYEPFKPYHQFMNTPESSEFTEEMHRLAEAGELRAGADWFTAGTKPVEELYDIENDPHEIHNLAGKEEYRDVLQDMRRAHREWLLETKDLGLIPEPELVKQDRTYGSRYAILRQPGRDKEEFLRQLHGAASLAGAPDITGLPMLMELFDNRHPSVRYWAATGVGNLGRDGLSAKALVERGLDDEAACVRVASARALFKMDEPGEIALPVLIDELGSSQEWVRLQAALVLDSIGERARPAIPALKEALKDTHNKYVVRVANRALNQMLGTNNTVR